jgi:ATP-dependent Clp protease, protease subunit
MEKNIDRIMMLSDDIDNETISDIIMGIFSINCEDEGLNKEDREPIKLILNSYGGNTSDGFALVDAIENSITPIHVIALGSAQSMGLAVVVAGHYRISGKHTRFMFHGISCEIEGKLVKQKQELKESKILQDMYTSYIISKTKLSSNLLNKAIKTDSEIYWGADKALNLGIIDKIIE